MKVRATQLGYYGYARRRVGDIFDIKTEKEFSKKWMEKLDDVDDVPKREKVVEPRGGKPTGLREVI